jgi:hypothetical protein
MILKKKKIRVNLCKELKKNKVSNLKLQLLDNQLIENF